MTRPATTSPSPSAESPGSFTRFAVIAAATWAVYSAGLGYLGGVAFGLGLAFAMALRFGRHRRRERR